MYLFRIFYSFLPLRNPIGFGVSDFIIIAIAILMVVLLIAKAWLSPFLRESAAKTIPCMVCLFAGVILLRLVLFAHSPTPVPSGADDFGYLLLGDTLSHFRLSNPTHMLHQFFEAVFILQQPTYSSIYPLAQGFVLAAGKLLGNPWLGVLLSSGIFCAGCYWMLRAWTAPIWALAGGVLAVAQFGPLSPWLNSYWGGYVSAIAGCLVFGALPRLRQSARLRDGLILGAGLGLQILSRPFEATFLAAAIAIYFVCGFHAKRVNLQRPIVGASAMLTIAFAFTLLQNKAVTQSWTTMPYMLSRYQYGVPATLTFQPNAIPHRSLTPEQELDYKAQTAIHGSQADSLSAYTERLTYRFRYLRFFLLPPFFFAVFASARVMRQRPYLWALGTICLFILGSNFYPYFYPHYLAAITCLFLLFCVLGLARLSSPARSFVLLLSLTSFVFWFGVYASGDDKLLPLTDYQSWNYINFGDPQGRLEVQHKLLSDPARQLVFVHYAPFHKFEEWIHNDADIDRAQIVWANDLGAEENLKLLHYYPQRKAWRLEPDVYPPALTPYPR